MSDVSKIYKSDEGIIWIGSYNYSGYLDIISKYDKNTLRFLLLDQVVDKQYINNAEEYVCALCETPDGNIWIGTENKGIFSYNPKTKSLNSLFPELSNTTVFQLVRDKNNNIWIGTSGKGLYLCQR